MLGAISPGPVSALVAPVLLKYRVCRPRLLLAGSRAEVDPAADVSLLRGEVLLIEDAARQYNSIGDTDRRYRATEKLLHTEDEYHEILRSAKELYSRPLARNHPEYHDIIFKPLENLANVSGDLSQRILPTAVNKGQLSQPVNSRIICCKLIGKICTRFDSQLIKKDVLPTVHSLCQDVNSDVRACVCLQLRYVAEGLGSESVKSALLPSIVELASDEESNVRHASVQTIVYLLPHLQPGKTLIFNIMITGIYNIQIAEQMVR
ncbi:hypothetical protein PV327_005238 [Microctonus hyperodae]|uniref:Phosphatase PP2A regulatory subunit A/Splicing factor 3B subunit 1-like HEAT repeat domain-containing protein n=1 Tax=Microctonus hyperodae TaxID=165561 RepID=A0AA39G1P9_MICHY|nr:hypothetical protein PV327_005238 [Microctonus hyperodae]